MLKQQDAQDQVARTFLKEHEVVTYGLEMGNWYGFAGIPMSTGIASFVEVVDCSQEPGRMMFEARVLMPHLDAHIRYASRLHDDVLSTELTITSNTDSLLGDAVLHMTLRPRNDIRRFNGRALDTPGCYVYSSGEIGTVETGCNKKLRISASLKHDSSDMDIRLVPYAAWLPDGRLRYHTRALCLGGANSYLVMRSKGAINCWRLGRYGSFPGKWLYRNERKAPKFFPNTQFCAVTRFPKGEQLTLCHRIELF